MAKVFDQLQQIKERYRNTFSHGGYEKNGQSFFVNIPYVGSVPLALSNYNRSVHFKFHHIEEPDFNSICLIIDNFERMFENDDLMKRKIKILESGLNIRFDYADEYHEVLKSDKNLYDFLDYESELWARNVNMDW